MSSYGHAYLTSYGWTGTGTGLRKDAIAKPLAIPPKKNLSGLGKDRDEAFPFWDHLFAAASKAITIKIASDNEDEDDTVARHDPVRRTHTGIISNRRPISGTPASASTSGNTTPSTDTGTTLSLLATAKREAAKHGLYSRFFRGPVLGPDDDPRVSTASGVAPECSSLFSTLAHEHGEQDGITAETRQGEKRKSKDNAESKEERRERKKLKKERRAARAAKKAEALAREKAKEKKSKGHQRRPSTHVDATDASNIVFTTKKKKGKRKDTLP